ncbi:hypothetical protein PUR57_00180, partial [Streptomyces sp. JV176]|uniref:hypothetical protein n=1 Tax=Streptomyces sp. JV176 TaxID=858630 RepID=UPI002E7A06BD
MTHSLTAAMVVAALGASALPALAAPVVPLAPAADPSGPGSVWGGSAPALEVPPVRTGATRPVAPVAEAEPSAEVAAWRAAQQERSSSASASASTG